MPPSDIVLTCLRRTIIEAKHLSPDLPILIANLHKNHEQIGEMMGLAWEFERKNSRLPQFLLAHHQEGTSTAIQRLHEALAGVSRPLQLWMVNFSVEPSQLEAENCYLNSKFKRIVPGYRYQLYQCQNSDRTRS